MDIVANKYEITMSQEELWMVAIDLRRALYSTFENHWVYHQETWRQNESQRLGVLRAMFFNLGRPDLFDDISEKAEEIFKEFNNK